METVRMLQKFRINIDTDKINVNENKKPSSTNINAYRPRTSDSLLWCMMALIEGTSECSDNMSTQFKYETSFKYKQINTLREKMHELKKCGLDPLLIETNFISEKYMSFDSFKAMCIIHNLCVIYVNKNTYIRVNGCIDECNDGAPTHIVTKDANYTMNRNVTPEVVESVCKHKYEIINVKKPINGIGSYKVDDLRKICDKIGIETTTNNKNKTKVVLYREICAFIGL